jgi:hypothetical protein
VDDLFERIRDLAEGLAIAHFDGPPVDVAALAERLGIAIERTAATPRWVIRGKGPVILLTQDLPPERARFILAHEIVEVQCALASPPLPIARDEASRAEWLFQTGASDLLMPCEWFEREGTACGWDLAHLRERFDVSWEAAARRVPVCTPATCTVIDNGHVTARVGSPDIRFPRRLEPTEREATDAAYAAWPSPTPQRREASGFRCEAWPALPERNRIRRVCLLTYPTDW